MERCEVLLMLGTDFPYKDFYPVDASIVQVDLRAENLGRRAAIHTGLVGDVKQTVDALLPTLETKTDDAHLQHCINDYKHVRADLDKAAAPDRNKSIVFPNTWPLS